MPKRKNRRDVTWVVCDSNDQTFKCLRCGKSHPMGPYPKPVTQFAKEAEAFSVLHELCKEAST
jgi:hypothetical protein